MQRGSGSELTSGVPLADRNMIVVDERVARDANGQPLASWELVVVIGLPRVSDGQPTNVTLRAVTPRAFEVRGGIQVVEGRSFTPGLDEVIVGRKLHEAHPAASTIGGNVKYQQKLFKIVGLFESTGGAFESEVWGDYDTFSAIFQRGGGSNSLVLRMKDPAAIPELDRFIRAQPQMQLQALLRAPVLRGAGGPARAACCRDSRASSPSSWASAPCSGRSTPCTRSSRRARARSGRCARSASRAARSWSRS